MNESRATRYQRARRRAHAAGVLSGGAVLLALALTPAGAGLAGWADGASRGWAPALAPAVGLIAFTLAVAVLWEVAWLPAAWYLAARVNGPGDTPADWRSVLAAQAQAMFVAGVAALAGGAAVQGAAGLAGSGWWAVAAALLAAVLVAAMRVGPAAIARVSGARPVTRPALVERLGELARRVKVDIASIDQLPVTAGITATRVGRLRRRAPGVPPPNSFATGTTTR
jgi:MFS family permease